MPQESPLYSILNEINGAAAAGLSLVAITSALALPEICANLVDTEGSTREKYQKWCRENLVGPRFSFLAPEDFWSMRCGALHEGRFGGMKHDIKQVIFVVRGGATYVNCINGDTYIYSLVDFCRYLTEAVYHWYETNRESPVLQANIPHLMQYREGGFPPLGGPTVIA